MTGKGVLFIEVHFEDKIREVPSTTESQLLHAIIEENY